MGVRQIIAIPSGVAATGKRLRSLLVDKGDAEARIGQFQARAAPGPMADMGFVSR
jgi:hypothetical protein